MFGNNHIRNKYPDFIRDINEFNRIVGTIYMDIVEAAKISHSKERLEQIYWALQGVESFLTIGVDRFYLSRAMRHYDLFLQMDPPTRDAIQELFDDLFLILIGAW